MLVRVERQLMFNGVWHQPSKTPVDFEDNETLRGYLKAGLVTAVSQRERSQQRTQQTRYNRRDMQAKDS